MEFCSVLVKLVEEKVVDTIDIIRNKDVMLAHFIDETVMFENELYTLVPNSSVGCLHILLREDFLNLWLKLEEKCKCYYFLTIVDYYWSSLKICIEIRQKSEK